MRQQLIDLLPSNGLPGKYTKQVLAVSALLLRRIVRWYDAALPFLAMTSGGLLLSLNAYAQVVADPSAPGKQRPTVVNSGNGTTQVNIQTPSAAGVSRNTYVQFDVPGQGVILNNSRVNTQSQIGGAVQANPWLATGEARIILNEVNSTNPSYIRGYVEVAGQRAQVIIANPSGINVDGGGFINVSRATLTTGTPIINGGNLDGYVVDRGQVSVTGAGLDARQTDYTDIIARSVAVNAGIWAQQLGVITGSNRIAIDANDRSPIAAASVPGNGAIPQYGIDVSQLGGMYANKIVLLGTEAGVGVHNAGSIGASAGEVIVTANGRLENTGDIAAKQAVQIKVAGDIANTGNLFSEAAMSLDAKSIANTGTLNSQQDIQIRADGLMNHGVINSAADVAATVQGDIDNSDGTIQARRIALSSTTGGIDNQRGKITQTAFADLEVTGAFLKNTGHGIVGTPAPAANNDPASPSTGTGAGDGGGTGGSSPSTTPSTTPDNQNGGNGNTGTTSPPVPVPNGYLRVAGTINNDGGSITSGGALTVDVKGLDNSDGSFNVRTLTVGTDGTVNRQGNINVTGNVVVNGGAVDNRSGKIMVGGSLQGSMDSANNQDGTIQANLLNITVANDLDNTAGILKQSGNQDTLIQVGGTFDNQGGSVETLGNLALQANSITGESGKIVAQGNLQIDSADASVRHGQWLSGGNTAIAATTLDNTSGIISAGADLDVQSTALINQGGKIAADNIVIRAGDSLDNRAGTIQASAAMDVQTSGALTNDDGIIEAIGTTSNLIVKARDISTANGRIVNVGTGDTNVIAANALVNSGTVAGNGKVMLSAANLQNQAGGSIGSVGQLVLDVVQQINNAGTIASADTLDVGGSASMTNSGQITSAGNMSIRVASLDNSNGQLATLDGTGADIALNVGSLRNTGNIQADRDLAVVVSGAIDNTLGILHAGRDANVSAGTALTNSNVIEAAGTLDVQAASVSNSGRIVNAGNGTTSITSDGDIANSGTIAGNGVVNLSAATLHNNATGIIASGAELNLDIAQALVNQGIVNSNGTLTFNNSAASFSNSGKITGGRNIVITANTFDNSNGTIETGLGSSGDFSLRSTMMRNSAGRIATDRDIDIQAQQLQSAGQLSAGQDLSLSFSGNYTVDANTQLHADHDLSLVTTGALTNASTIEAGNQLTVSANALNNTSAGVIQANDTVLTVAGTLDNAGEIHGANSLDITAGTVNNSNAIIGGNVVIKTQNLNNAGSTALLGSTGDMSLWIAGQLNNTNGATIYSAGNMAIASNAARDSNGLLTGRTAVIKNIGSTIEAARTMEMVANTVSNVRPDVTFGQVTTVDETRHMTIPSWWVNGPNQNVYSPVAANYSPHEIYYVNPADILENSTYVTPDGYTIGRAVIRTHANDSIFFTATSGLYGAYGHTERIGSSDGTKVIYYITSQTGQANPDQVTGTDGGLVVPGTTWDPLPTFSSQYGSCSMNCIRLVTQPGYDDPTSTFIRDTFRYLSPTHDALEIARDAHHVAVDDVLLSAGAEAKIRSGGNMRIAVDQSLTNQYASIMAGGALQVDGGTTAAINNIGQTLYRTHSFDGTWYTTGGAAVHYDMPSISEVIGSVGGVMSGSQGVVINGRSFSNIDLSAGTAADIRSSVNVIGSNANGPGNGTGQTTAGTSVVVGANVGGAGAIGQSPGAGSVVKVAPSGLFQQSADGKTLFTTRAPFTQGNAAAQTSSDYFFQALGINTASVQKRLGDGYYEQSLVRDQLAALTGKVSSNANDDSEYKALMTAGVSFAQEWHLTPGVALTADQVAHLTSDIVWMESQTVVLPDGTTQTVLVPKVYLAHVDDKAVKPSGALVTGEDVIINTGDIINKGGLIDGGKGNTILLASNDISNLGGIIRGEQIVLSAGGDVRNETLTVTETYANAQNRGSYTSTSNQATIAAGDSLVIQAGRDITDIGGVITAGVGKDKGTGDILISAGRDLKLEAVQTGSDYTLRTGDYYGSASTTNYQGSQISSGGNLTLSAGQDMKIDGAQIAIGTNGSGSGVLVAGRDIDINAVTNERATDAGKDPGKNYARLTTDDQTVVGTQIAATDNLTIKAGATQTGNLTVTGSTVASGGDTILAASGDVAIRETMERHSYDYLTHSSSKNLISSKSSTTSDTVDKQLVAGSSVSGDSVKIVAGNDIHVSGSEISAQQDATLIAARDIVVTTATATDQESHGHQESKSGFSFGAAGPGYGSSSANQNQNSSATTQIGSVISGATVTTVSGRDTTIQGSTIVADGDIDIVAGRDLSILSAQNTSHTENASDSKKSGTIGSFFQAMTIGTVKNAADGTGDSITQVGSQVASLGGDVHLNAGEKYTQTASDVLAMGGNIAIGAKDVLINEAYDSYAETQHQTYSKTAIGSSVSIPIVNMAKQVKNLAGIAQTAKKTKNGRMQALSAVTMGLGAYNVYSAFADPAKSSTLKVSVSIGSSKSESTSLQTGEIVKGSTVAAGGDVNIVATGAGVDSNINIIGSDISAGKNAILMADNEVNLEAAWSKQTQNSSNSSSGASIGIGFAIGGQTGITFDFSLNAARGKANGTDVVATNTHVTAGDTAFIVSGGDTNLKGAVVKGDTVIADIGGDLNIESLQDISTYDSKQKSGGIDVSLCIPPICGGASSVSGNYAQQNIHSTFQSVIEQSGIKAGDGGYDITVKGNSDLKGAVIASNQQAIDEGKNILMTGTLTTSDIHNHASYSGESIGVGGGYSFGGGSNNVGKNETGGADGSASQVPGTTLPSSNKDGGASANLPVVMQANGSADSITPAGVSGGTIVITDDKKQQELTGKDAATTVASINYDVSSDKDSSNALKPIFNEEEIKTGFEITQAFVNEAGTFIANQAKEIDRAKERAKSDDATADMLEQQAQGLPEGEERIDLLNQAQDLRTQAITERQQAADIDSKWGPGGTYRQILTAITAAASGNVSGSTTQFVENTVINYVQAKAAEGIKELASELGIPEGSAAHTALHAITACAGAAAQDHDCGAAALGASSATIISALLSETQGDAQTLTNEQKEAREALIATLATGLGVMAGDAAAANTAALIEMENNSNVKNAVKAAINDAKAYLSGKAKEGGEKLVQLLEKLEIKPMVEMQDAIRDYLNQAATRGGLTDTEIAVLGALYAANEVLFPTSVLDLLNVIPGAGKAIKTAGELIKVKVLPEEAAKIAAVEMKAERALQGPIFKTTAEATAAAKALGYQRIAETVNGQAVYQKGKLFITRDADGHNGGAWKMADSVRNLGSKETRMGTYSADLKRIGD